MSLIIGVGGKFESGKDAFADRLVDAHGFIKLGMSDVLAQAMLVMNPWIRVVDSPPGKNREFYELIEAGIPLEPELPKNHFFSKYQDIHQVLGYVQSKEILEVREWLQLFGTEVGRRLLGESTWTDIAYRRLVEQSNAGQDVVITGVRYANEIDIFDQLAEEGFSATTVFVDRPGHVPAVKAGAAAAHSSENSLSAEEFQYQLSNNSDLKGLEQRSDALLSAILRDYRG